MESLIDIGGNFSLIARNTLNKMINRVHENEVNQFLSYYY